MTDSNENKGGIEYKPRLEFSEFHPLMHMVFSPECFGWYGGPWRHLELWWDYGDRPRPIAALKCRLGRHYKVPYWVGRTAFADKDNPTGFMCHYCHVELGGSST